MDPAELVQRWWDEVWAGRLDVIDELVAEPYVRHGTAGTKRQTRDQVRDDMRQYLRAHGSPKVTIADQAVVGDKVWSRVRTEGVSIETGELSTICWLQVHRVDDDDRLAEVWTLYSHDAAWP